MKILEIGMGVVWLLFFLSMKGKTSGDVPPVWKEKNATFLREVQKAATKLVNAASTMDMPSTVFHLGRLAAMFANVSGEKTYYLGVGYDTEGWRIRGGSAGLIIGGVSVRSPFGPWNHEALIIDKQKYGGRVVHLMMNKENWEAVPKHKTFWTAPHENMRYVIRFGFEGNEIADGCTATEERWRRIREAEEDLGEDTVLVAPLELYCAKYGIPVIKVKTGVVGEEENARMLFFPVGERTGASVENLREWEKEGRQMEKVALDESRKVRVVEDF